MKVISARLSLREESDISMAWQVKSRRSGSRSISIERIIRPRFLAWQFRWALPADELAREQELQSIQAITSLGSCGCIRNMDNAREIGRGNYFSRVERRILASIRQQRVNALSARRSDINRLDLSHVNVYKFPAIAHSVARIAH